MLNNQYNLNVQINILITNILFSSCTSFEYVTLRESRVKFSSSVLEFGILPDGLNIKKHIWVENLSVKPTKWKIVEVKYNIDFPPFMEIINSQNISCDSGEFLCICRKQKIFYSITTEVTNSAVVTFHNKATRTIVF